MTTAHCSVFIRPLDRRRPQSSLPVARGGGTACSPAVTEGIDRERETFYFGAFGQPHPPSQSDGPPSPSRGRLKRCDPLLLSWRKEDGLTIAHCSVFIRPLDRRRPQSSLLVVRGGGTACPPAVTEGIATDEGNFFFGAFGQPHPPSQSDGPPSPSRGRLERCDPLPASFR